LPNVVVYVSAPAWRKLEGRGEDPSLWVRATVREALRAAHDPEVSVKPLNVKPKEGAPAPGGPGVPHLQSESKPRAKRTGLCEHRVPLGSFCKLCDS
jgi:hypothetical protein